MGGRGGIRAWGSDGDVAGCSEGSSFTGTTLHRARGRRDLC